MNNATQLGREIWGCACAILLGPDGAWKVRHGNTRTSLVACHRKGWSLPVVRVTRAPSFGAGFRQPETNRPRQRAFYSGSVTPSAICRVSASSCLARSAMSAIMYLKTLPICRRLDPAPERKSLQSLDGDKARLTRSQRARTKTRSATKKTITPSMTQAQDRNLLIRR
ncbi:hypothetical protein LZ30DRAFT_325512 [Colletotrichum cereale]|nr:hypothetical protein LZ30DRAFT_325512 [Colletotrichum cereale]